VSQHLSALSLLVREYDEAIAWFTSRLGFWLIEDTPLGDGKRWVVVRPSGAPQTGLLLAKAATDKQAASIGKQAGGRVFLFLETSDFARDHQAMLERGVVFREAARNESYGRVAVFEDLWDLIERAPAKVPDPACAP
jgi:catechol 2,3-dioxygenase-like lactoylglutathione lyase family enzyme